MVKKRTLIVMCPTMDIGGVQQNFITLIRYSLSSGNRVIWLYKKPIRLAQAYTDILERIEYIDYHINSSLVLKCPTLSINREESAVWLTSTPHNMHLVIGYCNANPELDITPLYIVSNTKGRYNYLENYYWGPAKSIVFSKWMNIVASWHERNLIRYFDINHFYTYSKVYGITHDQPYDLVWKHMCSLPKLDVNALDARLNRKAFNLISVTRFDFPHKQYLLGLIRDFATLKEKYSHIKLHIIGYGQDENKVKATIGLLPCSVQKDIIIHGPKSEMEIISIMKVMHLNISVAACVELGAKCGVLSIPARNFCGPECEVYGYLPESRRMTVSTEPGSRAIAYIEEVINMSDEEYRKKCIDSYKAYEVRDVEPDYMLKQKGKTENLSFEHEYNAFFRVFQRTSDYFWKIGDIANKMKHIIKC